MFLRHTRLPVPTYPHIPAVRSASRTSFPNVYTAFQSICSSGRSLIADWYPYPNQVKLHCIIFTAPMKGLIRYLIPILKTYFPSQSLFITEFLMTRLSCELLSYWSGINAQMVFNQFIVLYLAARCAWSGNYETSSYWRSR